MSTESRKCATESVQREFTTRRGDWDRLAGCLSLGLVGWLNNLLRSLVKNQVSKKSWRFAMLLLTLVSITAGGQSAWAALLPDGGGVECLTFRHSNIPQLDPNLVQRYGRTVCGVYCSDKTYYRMACDADMFKDGFTIDDLRKGTKIGGFVLPAVSLTITKTGNGTITSTPTGINFTGINCGTDCSTEDYIPNTDVKLTAIASAGYVFDRWSGSCKGNDNSIVVKMDAAKSCTANFVSFVSNDWVSLEMPSSIRGTVWKDLNGDGIRQPTLGEVGFNSTTVFLKQGTSPELRMVTNLDGNYTTFSNLVGKQTLYVGTTTGWVQTYPANPQYYGVDLRQNQQVIGKDFGIAPAFDLAVTKIGTGDVKSTDGLINCGATCTGAYAINKAVTLQAAAGLGFQFDKWTGTGECNNNSANPINVQMIAAKTCTANFSSEYVGYLKRAQLTEVIGLMGSLKGPAEEFAFENGIWLDIASGRTSTKNASLLTVIGAKTPFVVGAKLGFKIKMSWSPNGWLGLQCIPMQNAATKKMMGCQWKCGKPANSDLPDIYLPSSCKDKLDI